MTTHKFVAHPGPMTASDFPSGSARSGQVETGIEPMQDPAVLLSGIGVVQIRDDPERDIGPRAGESLGAFLGALPREHPVPGAVKPVEAPSFHVPEVKFDYNGSLGNCISFVLVFTLCADSQGSWVRRRSRNCGHRFAEWPTSLFTGGRTIPASGLMRKPASHWDFDAWRLWTFLPLATNP